MSMINPRALSLNTVAQNDFSIKPHYGFIISVEQCIHYIYHVSTYWLFFGVGGLFIHSNNKCSMCLMKWTRQQNWHDYSFGTHWNYFHVTSISIHVWNWNSSVCWCEIKMYFLFRTYSFDWINCAHFKWNIWQQLW